MLLLSGQTDHRTKKISTQPFSSTRRVIIDLNSGNWSYGLYLTGQRFGFWETCQKRVQKSLDAFLSLPWWTNQGVKIIKPTFLFDEERYQRSDLRKLKLWVISNGATDRFLRNLPKTSTKIARCIFIPTQTDKQGHENSKPDFSLWRRKISTIGIAQIEATSHTFRVV